jgi:hypothetical protein
MNTNPNTGAMLVLGAGAMTFVTKFYYTQDIDWKIVIATPIISGGFALLGKLDASATMILGLMALLTAATTKFNGESFVDILTALAPGAPNAPKTPVPPTAAPAKQQTVPTNPNTPTG